MVPCNSAIWSSSVELEDLRCEIELGEVPPLDHGVPLRDLLVDPRIHAGQVLLQAGDAFADRAHAHRHVALGDGHGVEGRVRLERCHPSKPALQCVQFAHDLVVGSISVHPLPLGCPRDGPGASARMVRTSAVRGNSAVSGRCIMVR